ncbi:hypothetical protein Ahia01_000591500 [Argonauta hians]
MCARSSPDSYAWWWEGDEAIRWMGQEKFPNYFINCGDVSINVRRTILSSLGQNDGRIRSDLRVRGDLRLTAFGKWRGRQENVWTNQSLWHHQEHKGASAC